MKTSLSLLATVLLFSSAAFGAPATNSILGNWLGTLDTGAAKLRVMFKITNSWSGVLSATLDSLDQGASDIPVNSIALKNDSVRLEVKAVAGTFDGTLDETGKKITGTWEQAGHSLPLVLERHEGAVAVATPEELSPEELAASKQAAQRLSGVWNGTLAVGDASLRLKLKIAKSATGAATGTVTSLDQSEKEIPLSGITYKEGAVHLEARGIGVQYDGTLSPAGVMLTGKWLQSGQALPLEFKKAASSR
jgi:hypothetical protein